MKRAGTDAVPGYAAGRWMTVSRFDLDVIEDRLRGRAASRALRWLPARRAGVAVILDAAGRVLLMKRAARAGDRWSEHVSLPGGMAQASDVDALATAVREAREEVGVDCREMKLLGALDELPAIANGGLRPMSISPFVFASSAPVVPAVGAEVASIFWLPLDLAAGGTLDDRLTSPVLGVPFRFACWRYEGHVIWGLTYGVLQTVLRLARPR